jgi:cytochrome oxidase Cu insertion factor (SCO1/SenC/PrrC family)
MKLRRPCSRVLIAALALIATWSIAVMSTSGAGGPPTDSKLDTTRKIKVLTEVPMSFRSGKKVDPADWKDFVRARNDNLKTGPSIGDRVPDFELADQNGKQWTLHDLMGPSGLLLVFTRSADW